MTAPQFKIPFVDFKRRYALLREEMLAGVDEVFASGHYILGPEVDTFEKKLAEYLDAPYVLSMANGTDTMIIALKIFGVGPGDEVILPVNSFIATAGAVVAVGAKPVFCDVASDLNIDVTQIEALINKNTRAIIPVHLTGRPADMDAINQFAEKHHLYVIEDAAQSIGARYQGKKVGSLGNVGSFSLHPLKNLHVYGDGGLIVTKDKKLYDAMKLFRNHGLQDRDTCAGWGLNSRLDAIQARIGSINFKYLDRWNERRRAIAEQYRQHLSQYLSVPEDETENYSVYHNCVVQTEERDALVQHLAAEGIEVKVHYPIPLHLQPAAQSLGYKKGDFPIAEKLAQTMMSLPVYPELEDEEVQCVISGIRGFFKG